MPFSEQRIRSAQTRETHPIKIREIRDKNQQQVSKQQNITPQKNNKKTKTKKQTKQEQKKKRNRKQQMEKTIISEEKIK